MSDEVKVISEDEAQHLPVITLDEARAQICRSTAAVLANSVSQARVALQAKRGTAVWGPQEDTEVRLMRAAQELAVQLLRQARKLDRPTILRPDRRVRLARIGGPHDS